MFAKVVVDIKSKDLNETYTYHVPIEYEDFLCCGSRVLVDFGARKILGYVIELSNETDYDGTMKDIVEILDYTKQLSQEQIDIAKFLSEQTHTELSKCLDVMFPAVLKSKYERFIKIVDEANVDPNVLLLFKDKKKILLTKELLKDNPKIKKELERKTIELDYDVKSYGKRKLKKFYSVNEASFSAYDRFDGIKRDLIDYLLNVKLATIDNIRENVGCSDYLVQSLVKSEVLTVTEEYYVEETSFDRVPLQYKEFVGEKKDLLEKYNNLSLKPFLFYTNDDEFSLDFYYNICCEMLMKHKKVLFVTPTLINNYYYFKKFSQLFTGYSVLNFSGSMTDNEFYDNYIRLINDDCDIVITTKVGAFLPINELGLIIVCDESNFNYINEMTPKYNLIEVLKYRSVYNNAKLILESDPMTVDNYYYYFQAKYNILQYIKEPIHHAQLVDMREAMYQNRTCISQTLENRLSNALEHNDISLLILNQRGYSNHLVCPNCGDVLKCDKCNIPMTYFKEKNEVRCKYCGKKSESIVCKCGYKYEMSGLGLELVEEKVKQLFPNASTLIIGSDTMREYDKFKEIVIMLETKQIDIVIGTNNALSLATYADFNLIGLISVDNLLNTSDYRSSYNTFSLIVNSLKVSDLIIQGFDLSHYSIRHGVNCDFVSFYNEEIKNRENYKYAPFYEINKLVITGDYNSIYYAANYFRKIYGLKFNDNNLCLGPTYNKIKRGVQLILKHKCYEKVIEIIEDVKTKFKDYKIEFSYERYPRVF